MNYKAELYRKCHQELAELYDKRQRPLFNVDNEVKNRLIHDGAIRRNDLSGLITTKGEGLFLNKYYIELAEEVENKEREKELRERDSFTNQRSVEESIKQTKINWDNRNIPKYSLIIAGIALLLEILEQIKSCK